MMSYDRITQAVLRRPVELGLNPAVRHGRYRCSNGTDAILSRPD